MANRTEEEKQERPAPAREAVSREYTYPGARGRDELGTHGGAKHWRPAASSANKAKSTVHDEEES